MPDSGEGRFSPALYITLLAGALIWFIPAPEGVSIRAWHLLAIFVATIVGFIAKPFPMEAIAILALAAVPLTGTLTLKESLSGFGHPVLWLLMIAFFLSGGFVKMGLGARIAYCFIAAFGRRSLGLGYSLIVTDLLLAPAILSNTARTGAIVFPILRSIARSYGSEPHDGTARRIGAFLIQTSFQGTVITSAMFLTAMAANPLAAELAAHFGVEITWGAWALAAAVPGLVSLAVVPWVLYKTYPPEIRDTPEAAQIAIDRLAEMGRLKRREWIMLGTFTLLLLLWILGGTLA